MTNTKKAKERITDTLALLGQLGFFDDRRKDSKHDEVAARVAAMHAEAEGCEDA